MLKISNYLTDRAAEKIRAFIREAGGNEVFLVGKVNEEKIVERVQIFARGNAFSAPALLQVAAQGDVVIHNHPSGVLLPSTADMSVASTLGNDGVGFFIVDNDVSDIYAVVEPFCEKTRRPIDTAALRRFISEKGPVARKLENYEFRAQQLDMTTAVSEGMNEDKLVLVEAGTGTGKTLAYLLPAITQAVDNDERIVVSTNTINLQEQLMNKDLPFLRSVLKKKFNAVLVKGRSNYVCKRKVAEAKSDPDLFSDDDERDELAALLRWAESTSDGSKTDLNVEPRSAVWEKIQSESDTSLKTRCPFYNECFFYKARRNAASADILVANHHLLFADLALRLVRGETENAILPTYERIVFDEAHNVEEVATNYFGTRVTYLGMLRILRQLYREKKGQEKGLLVYLSRKLEKFARRLPHEAFLQAQKKIQQDGIEAVKKLSVLLSDTMERIYNQVEKTFQREATFTEMKLRLTGEIVEGNEWQNEILLPVKGLIVEIHRFTSGLQKFLEKVSTLQRNLGELVISLTVDAQAQLDRLEAAANGLEQVLLEDEGEVVRWVEIRRGYQNVKIVRLVSSPLNVAPILRESVFQRFKNVTLTSATLTVEGSFDYIKRRLGLDAVEPGRLIELSLSSPFDYETQVLVGIPNDIPEPNSPEFFPQVSEVILQALNLAQGGAFVLFTSYGLLNKIYFQLRDPLVAQGFTVLKQGQENRHRLLNRFRNDVSSILFATDSFWEGVDVQGQTLQLVIITKLPFKVPSEPIVEARIEEIDRRGGNAFIEYTVPQAAIKFKQGFGRLIRTKNDRGCVLILDKRVVQKRYGRIFLNSLPRCRVTVGSKEDVLTHLGAFYQQTS